jgi:serine/threonine protein kinase
MYDNFWEIPNEKLILILEFGDAGDLADFVNTQKDQRKQVNEKKALEIFIQVAYGLAFLHQQHILHRDLKSKNIFLFKNGRAVIGDFGTSKVLDNASAFASTLVGSPLYMSPEVLEDKPYSFAADIWALGCILYELLVYVTPFNGPSYPAVVRKITSGKYAPLPDRFVSFETRQLVQRMLDLDPRKRPSVHEILAMPLFLDTLTQVATYQPFPIPMISSPASLDSAVAVDVKGNEDEETPPPVHDDDIGSNTLESTLEATCSFSLLPPPVPIEITSSCEEEKEIERDQEGNQETNELHEGSSGNHVRHILLRSTYYGS